MSDISSILQSSFKGLKLDAILKEYNILKVWNEVVGEKISGKAQPFKTIGSTLYVNVSSSPWMQELNYMKDKIITKLNEKSGEKKVDDIIFKIGRWDKQKRGARTRKPSWLRVHLDKEDKDSIQKVIESLKDCELKEILSHVITLEKRLNIFKKKRFFHL